MLIFNQAHEVFCTAKYVRSLDSLFDSPSVMVSRDGPEPCGRNTDTLAERLERSSMHRRHGGKAGFLSTAHKDSVIPALSLKLRLHVNKVRVGPPVRRQHLRRINIATPATRLPKSPKFDTEMVGRLPVSILLRLFCLGNSSTFVHFAGIHLPVLRRAPL